MLFSDRFTKNSIEVINALVTKASTSISLSLRKKHLNQLKLTKPSSSFGRGFDVPNTFAGALDLGYRPDGYHRDSVGKRDRGDVFKFRAGGCGCIAQLDLFALSNDADLTLYNESGRRIAESWTDGSEQILKYLRPGTYYIHVFPYRRRSVTKYELQIQWVRPI